MQKSLWVKRYIEHNLCLVTYEHGRSFMVFLFTFIHQARKVGQIGSVFPTRPVFP